MASSNYVIITMLDAIYVYVQAIIFEQNKKEINILAGGRS